MPDSGRTLDTWCGRTGYVAAALGDQREPPLKDLIDRFELRFRDDIEGEYIAPGIRTKRNGEKQ